MTFYTKFDTLNLIVKNNINSAKILLSQTNVVYKVSTVPPEKQK